MENIKQLVEDRREAMVAMRREFHRHPELSFEEKWTADIIEARLKEAGLDDVRPGVGGHGVLGTLEGGKPGRTIMVRADIDGLPIDEQNSANYVSQNRGVMHACGHDGHITIALMLASIFAQNRAELPGTIKFAFQPAEELGGGAKPMLDAGIMSGPEVDAVVGLHLWNNLPAGQIGVCNGPIFAGADTIEIIVKGKGGHGALPHQTVDALLVGAEIVVALQTIISREILPGQPAVVSVGSFHSGTASNIINSEAKMALSIRSTTAQAREYLIERVQNIATNIAKAMRAEVEFNIKPGIPPVVNDPVIADAVRLAGRAAIGTANVQEVVTTTVSDDMSYFLQAKPGCYFLVGSANVSGGETFPHHHPRFDLDEKCLVPGVEVLGRSVLELGQK